MLLTALVPAAAHAHPVVDEAIAHYRQAEFDKSLELLDKAAGRDDLSRADVVELLRHRALVRFATGKREAMADDLRKLATLDPEDGLGDDVPPPVAEAYERARSKAAPIAVEATAEHTAGGVRVSARLQGDDAGLVREVRVAARPGGGAWQRAAGEPVTVPVTSGATVEYFAAAIGPGGAAVASAGTEASPRTHVAGASASAGAATEGAAEGETGDRTALVWGLAAGGAAVGLVVIVTAVILVAGGGSGGNDSQLSGPRLEL